MSSEDFSTRITTAYASDGPAIDIGRAVLDGTTHADAIVQIPTAMCNRHGLIAGATGTGKTVTLQLLAEQLSAQGVPVFAADIKGDLSGVAKAMVPGDKVNARVTELGLTYTPAAAPVQFWSLGGLGPGVPVRATIGSFGPQLLAKVLASNDTQRSSLSLVFQYADTNGLPLLDLADLTSLLTYLVSDEGKDELKTIGGLASATAGVLLRDLSELGQQGAERFFGEPELDYNDLLRVDANGHGIINCLELSAVQDRPALFSTFLLWLLADLYEHLPEVGDLDKPKLVFFFDEAHLLFDGASKEFVGQVAQTVRLIRSKGVGVFFVTQLPDDLPDEILAQLGNRIQHGLRAFTPRDAKALKAAVTTYPKTDDYDLEQVLTQLGIGEAVVTVLTAKGTPTPVAWTKVRPPQSQIGAVDPAEVKTMAENSDRWATYATEIDRQSARELLAAKMGVTVPAAPAAATAPTAPASTSTLPPPPPPPPPPPAPGTPATGAVEASGVRVHHDSDGKGGGGGGEPVRVHHDSDQGVVTGFLKSREGRATVNTVLRGVFGLLKKSR